MLGIITTALIMMILSFGFTFASGQSVAPYSTCIKSSDHGYNIILQENNNCSSKQFSETVLYYQANGYNEVEHSNEANLQTVHLTR
ncbi:MAG: hypothetical protein E6K94_07885 [Thaumarchaeota archaeon]|nr:MAG: hypothetical protein E6K94_07885 [Nitrososphaerota archaeon]